MRIAVLGATGRTGVPLVAQAVEEGHDVRALVRTPAKRELLPAEVEVVEGDARDHDVVAELVVDAEVVVDVTGPVKGGPTELRRVIVPALLDAMGDAGVQRLVLLTGAGVRMPGDQPGLLDRGVRWLMERTVPEVLADGVEAVAAARSSDRDVAVVRAPRIVDGHHDGSLRVANGVGRGHGSRVGYEDLARFLLHCAVTGDHDGEAPVVSW